LEAVHALGHGGDKGAEGRDGTGEVGLDLSGSCLAVPHDGVGRVVIAAEIAGVRPRIDIRLHELGHLKRGLGRTQGSGFFLLDAPKELVLYWGRPCHESLVVPRRNLIRRHGFLILDPKLKNYLLNRPQDLDNKNANKETKNKRDEKLAVVLGGIKLDYRYI